MRLIDFDIDQLFCMDLPLSMISKDLGTIVIYYLLLLISAFNGTLTRGVSSSRVEYVILTYYKYLLCLAASIYVLS